MSVKEKNGSGELLEQGWRRMQGILDLEMPQHRKKRWGLWIPLGIVGMVLIIIAIMSFPTLEDKTEAPEQADSHKSFVQDVEKSELENGDKTLAYDVIAATDDEARELTQVQVAEESEFVPSDQSVVSQTTTSSTTSSASLSAAATASKAIASTATASTATATRSSSVASSSTTTTSFTTTASDPANSLNNVRSDGIVPGPGLDVDSNADKVPVIQSNEVSGMSQSLAQSNHEYLTPTGLEIVALAPLDYKPIVRPVIPAANQTKSKVGLEVFGAPHFVSIFEMRGVEAGLLASVTLGRRWKLLAGLSYGHYNTNGLIRTGKSEYSLDVETLLVPVIIDTTTFGNPAYDVNADVDYNKIGYDTAQLLSEKFNYMHMPINAQYRIGRFLSVTGGVKVSYLLNAPSSTGLSAVPLNSAQADPLDVNTRHNYLVEENILRKWDVAPMIGLALDFGRRMAFDLQYQHGLIHYVDRPTDGERSDYHRSLSLGLRYRIL